MIKRKRKNILPQMFDVRPVNSDGDLDYDRIRRLEKIVRVESRRIFPHSDKKIGSVFHDIKSLDNVINEDIQIENTVQPIFTEKYLQEEPVQELHIEKNFSKTPDQSKFSNNYFQDDAGEIDYFKKFETRVGDFSKRKNRKKNRIDFLNRLPLSFVISPQFFRFATATLSIFLVFFLVNLVIKGYGTKDQMLSKGKTAFASLLEAKENIDSNKANNARLKFSESYDKFKELSEEFDKFGKVVIGISQYVPYTSKLASGFYLAESGKNVSQIGMNMSEVAEMLSNIKNPLDASNQSFSLLEVFRKVDSELRETSILFENLEDNLSHVNISDIPSEQRVKFSELQERLPQIKAYLAAYVNDSGIFTDVLGGNGPRKYLILFQNNQEMRATGGFIGTYGLIDVSNGHIRNFFIDGIFNPDGQLKEKVVPPIPIQKISAAWSMHDSNWFPNFPTSAEKAAWFYEKTGGPTVDGVIAMTPQLLQKILEITGPIDMPEYGVTIDKDNFIEKIQEEVEVNYDRELNQPKKILADLAPKLLDRVFNAKDYKSAAQMLNIFYESLNEKQILIYSKNFEIEKILSENGWSGEVLQTQNDYVSVINTNINGYKTDGVVEEKITHNAEIQPDGSIIDTLTVTRHHNGGNMPQDWWNKVNADYMRVYVPKGSKLISVTGQTREFTASPLDYDTLNFKRDAQVKMEEDSIKIDEESGTKIYDDSGKTVFANWVYVSPQETAEIKYTYTLPFRIDTGAYDKPIGTYSLLAQKQSGSVGSGFISEIYFPKKYKIIWKYPDSGTLSYDEGFSDGVSRVRMETDLKTDKYVGIAIGN